MTPLLRRVLHVGVVVSALFQRAWETTARPFQRKADVAKRDSGRFEALKRREMELERLDRLRHPSNYQGR